MVRSSRQFPARLTAALTTAVFPMAHLVFFGPGASCFQRTASLLTLQPCFKSCFVNRQGENPWLAEQLPKHLHYLCCVGENNLVHDFRFALAGVSIEVNPLSVRAKNKHLFLGQHISRRHASLRNQIRTALAAGAKV